mgnify:CR=1 FL=1
MLLVCIKHSSYIIIIPMTFNTIITICYVYNIVYSYYVVYIEVLFHTFTVVTMLILLRSYIVV